MTSNTLINTIKESIVTSVLVFAAYTAVLYYFVGLMNLSAETTYMLNFIAICCIIGIMFLSIRDHKSLYRRGMIALCTFLIIINKLYIPGKLQDITHFPLPVNIVMAVIGVALVIFLPYIVDIFYVEMQHMQTTDELGKSNSSEEQNNKNNQTKNNETPSKEDVRGSNSIKNHKYNIASVLRKIIICVVFIAVAVSVAFLLITHEYAVLSFNKWRSFFETIIQIALLVFLFMLIIGALFNIAIRILHSISSTASSSSEKEQSDIWIYLACFLIGNYILNYYGKAPDSSINSVLNFIVDDGFISANVWYAIVILIVAKLIFSVTDNLNKLNDQCGDIKETLEDAVKTIIVGTVSMISALASSIFGDEGIRTLLDEDYEAYVMGDDSSTSTPEDPDNQPPVNDVA